MKKYVTKGMILLAGLTMAAGLVGCKKAPVATKIEVTAPTKTEYTINASIDLTGMVVTATFNDESTRDLVDTEYTTNVAEIDMSTVGEKEVVVTYGELTDSFTVTVIRTLTSIEITAEPDETVYGRDQDINLTGMVVTAHYDNGTSEEVEGYTTNIADIDMSTMGEKEVIVSFGGFSDSFNITVTRIVTSLVVTTLPNKIVYKKNEVFKPDGMVVTAIYDTQETAVIPLSDLTLSQPDMSQNDTEQVVDVAYKGKHTEFFIYIGKALMNLTVYDPTKTAYFLGDTFEPEGMFIDANFSDGTKETIKDLDQLDITEPDLSTLGSKQVFVSYGGKTDYALVAVLEHDYVHGDDMVMELDYEGRDFFKDGVGEFELWMTIDGDTAHFTPLVTKTSSETVKVRFYGVDTPESTGRIQEYGKQASNFTKRRLKNAAANGTIVLAGVSSEYGVPSMDANGRYLACVWISETVKHASPSQLVNLNLWIVQEGYSYVGSLDKMPEYSDVFNNAYWQARNNKLKLHSGRTDPYFNYGEYEPTDIPAIMKEAYATLDDSTHKNEYDGEKVKLTGTVVGYANNSLYLQQLDLETGNYYGINVFCGMTKPADKYLVPGTLIDLCGVAQDSENFGFQVTGAEGHFPILASKAKADDVHILTPATENTDPETALHTFEYTPTELENVSASRICLNSAVKLTATVTANYFNESKDGKKYTIGFDGVNFDLYLTTAFAGDPDNPNEKWTTEAQWDGKKILIKNGIFTYHTQASGKIRYQIVVTSHKDLEWVKD